MTGASRQAGSPFKPNRRVFGIGCVLLGMPGSSALDDEAPTLRLADAQRFLRVYRDHDGKPTAGQLEADYLGRGSQALQAFDTAAIGGAEAMASVILHDPTACANAADLMINEIAQVEMLSRRLIGAYERLSPSFAAPQIHLLFGSGTSSGQKLTGRRIALVPERFFASANWTGTFRGSARSRTGTCVSPRPPGRQFRAS